MRCVLLKNLFSNPKAYRYTCLLLLVIQLVGCTPEEVNSIQSDSSLATENVIIVVIDGVRYSESWGSNPSINIPIQYKMAKEGIIFTNFFNEKNTHTLSGHVAITTGFYEYVDNKGHELPSHHSIFQEFLKQNNSAPTSSWIITGKEKLSVLSDTKEIDWRASYSPSISAVDRSDQSTLETALKILKRDHPRLTLIQFREPDSFAHGNLWNEYIASISRADQYIGVLRDYLESDPFYKEKTTLLITSDHGRHMSGIKEGFAEHGDECIGCQHISLLAVGPDFETGKVIDTPYSLIDIAPSVASLLNMPWESEGQVIDDLF